jgi:hypothetical protein
MDGLMENAAVVGIHRKRGFPQLLGKVLQTAAGLSHISHRPRCHALFRDDQPFFGIDHNIWGSPTQNPEAPRKKKELFPFSSAFSSLFLFLPFCSGASNWIAQMDTSEAVKLAESLKELKGETRAIA